MDFTPLTDISQLEDIDFRSAVKKQLIFKHSTRCFTSITMLKKVKAELDTFTDPYNFEIYYLDLLKHRDISNEISQRYQVRHESPQLVVIQGGNCIAHASHGDINLKRIGNL